MPPIAEINVEDVEPMSRTYQYRKVMKPMLERKRRARMNKCLDDLKDLMVGALQNEGESITKLEKADVLELTVGHLKKLKRINALALPSASHTQEKFNSGFRQCTGEVTKFINATPGIDIHISNSLLNHLGGCMGSLEKYVNVTQSSPIHQSSSPINTPPTSPITVSMPNKMYTPPASPDNNRQLSPPTNQLNNGSSTTYSQSYSARVPIESMVVTPQTIHNSAVSSVNYKIAANQHYQQQIQQSARYHQQRTPSPESAAAPPTPPLSVGAPSPPVHVIQQLPHHLQKQRCSPKPTMCAAAPLFRIPVRQVLVTDCHLWRPW